MEYITITNAAYLFIILGSIAAIALSIQQAKGASEDKNEIIRKQELKISELDSTLQEKIKFIERYISGGESYPELEVLSLPSTSSQPSKMFFQIANIFDLPIYDIHFELYDYDFIKSKKIKGEGNLVFIKPSDFEKSRILSSDITTLSPKVTKAGLLTIEVKECNFYAKFFTRNKVIIQKITVLNYKGIYFIAWELFDDNSKKSIIKKYSPNIPDNIKISLDMRLNNIPNELNIKFHE